MNEINLNTRFMLTNNEQILVSNVLQSLLEQSQFQVALDDVQSIQLNRVDDRTFRVTITQNPNDMPTGIAHLGISN